MTETQDVEAVKIRGRRYFTVKMMELRGHGSRWTQIRKIRAGLLPAPVRLGTGDKGSLGYIAEEVEAREREREQEARVTFRREVADAAA